MEHLPDADNADRHPELRGGSDTPEEDQQAEAEYALPAADGNSNGEPALAQLLNWGRERWAGITPCHYLSNHCSINSVSRLISLRCIAC